MPILRRKHIPPAVVVAPPRWTDSARETVSRYPKIAWGTVAAVVGILGVIVPWGISLEARYQRVEAAKAAEEKIREDMKAHAQADTRSQAWAQFGQLRTESLVLRNRLNDCAVRTSEGKKLTALEQSICKQYDEEWHDADTRAKEARTAALAATKGGP